MKIIAKFVEFDKKSLNLPLSCSEIKFLLFKMHLNPYIAVDNANYFK